MTATRIIHENYAIAETLTLNHKLSRLRDGQGGLNQRKNGRIGELSLKWKIFGCVRLEMITLGHV